MGGKPPGEFFNWNFFMVTKHEIDLAASYIREGKLVAFPTETVYGLGANALDPDAVIKIFEMKERPAFDPLIVHIADIKDLPQLILHDDERVFELARRFWPGPLTLVLPKSKLVPDIVTSGLPTVGIRMPANPVALELIRAAGRPVAAPSANKFGKVSPTTAQHVKKQLKNVDYILDGGPTTVGIESTIIQLGSEGFSILRNGVIIREEIEDVVPFHGEAHRDDKVIAPGMVKSHYSPAKPLYILGEVSREIDRSRAGLLTFTGEDTSEYQEVIQVSQQQDLKEYAVNLFAAIHRLEESEVEYMIAEPVPEAGIGLAIMDRLRKAAYQYTL
jgi:L-threonylcarbamoyladenylate synthase